VAGGWGEHWSLFRLRLPSVFYSWAIAAMVGLLAWKISRDSAESVLRLSPESLGEPANSRLALDSQAIVTGALAAILYLSFFSSYRYGRPYLTSSPETFWLFGLFLHWPGTRPGWPEMPCAGNLYCSPGWRWALAACTNPLPWSRRWAWAWLYVFNALVHKKCRGGKSSGPAGCAMGFAPG